jgi:hypothetical protein
MQHRWVVLFVLLVLAALAGPRSAGGAVKAGDHFKVIPAADGRGEITVVANGLNYQDAAGNWIESRPVILEYPNAIICTGATYQVILAANLNTHGSVDLELPVDVETGERGRMISHPLGLAFYDPETGDSVLLARLQDCVPEVVSNKVVYADAFAGPNGIEGAITYTYGVGHFHQDVILTAQPTVTPADFGMGEHTRLEILTEFVAMPAPVITEKTLRVATDSPRPALVDQTLEYGPMRMGMGRAFATPEQSQSAATRDALPVVKQLVSIEDRTVLTEGVEWSEAVDKLEKLPHASGTNAVRQASMSRPVSRRQLVAQTSAPAVRSNEARSAAREATFTDRLAEIQRTAPERLAALDSPVAAPRIPTGFVVDYELVQTCPTFTFQSGQTYLINSYVQIAYLTIQSGAVIKYAYGELQPTYYLSCPSSGPKAVITDKNDNSVGEVIPGSVGYFTGYLQSYAALSLWQLNGYPGYIQNLDIRYAGYGITAPAGDNWCYVYNCWFFKCNRGVNDYQGTATVSYSDFCQVETPYSGSGYYDYYSCTTCAVTDRDGDGLPDAWEMQHFGGLSQPASGDYDGDGYTNLEEFTAGSDPNTISFTTHFTNLYVSNRTGSATLEVQGGVPYQKAVLINSTNLAGASWSAYSSNLSFTLPDADTNHLVLVALRGRVATNPPATDYTELTLDRVPPVLSITNPILASAAATVIKPYLQLQGFANEPLASLSYDLTNEFGLLTNGLVAVVDQYFDTNKFDFTTNWFQGYDIALATNANGITLRVADLAGNVTMTNFTVFLDYSTATNAPEVAVVWPVPGAHLSGDNFYIRGRVNDETATVVAQQVDGAGGTNTVAGIVERNGRFWVEGLPLSAGTNEWELIATDAAGNVTVTNVSVVRSEVVITITSTPTGESLYEPMGTVSGTISDPAYTVTVNGVQAVVDDTYANGDGSYNWTAENVPNNGPGTATFDVVAEPSGGGGSGGGSGGGGGSSGGGTAVRLSQAVEMPAAVRITRYLLGLNQSSTWSSQTWTKRYDAKYASDGGGIWKPTYQGNASRYVTDDVYGTSLTRYQWSDADPLGTQLTETAGGSYGPYPLTSEDWLVRQVPDWSENYVGTYVSHYYAKGVRHTFPLGDGTEHVVWLVARTVETLFTGGKAGIARQALFSLTATVTEYGKPNYPWTGTPWFPVAAERIEMLGEPLNSEGRLVVALPENQQIAMNLRVKNVPHFNAGSGQGKALLQILSIQCRPEFGTNLLSIKQDLMPDLEYGVYNWISNTATKEIHSAPALYISGSRVVMDATFAVAGGGVSETIVVRGKASGGGTSFTLWGTNQMTGGGNTFTVPAVTADTPLAANTVDSYNPLKIEWSYAGVKDTATGKLTEFVEAGVTTNQLYVCWKTPDTENRFHTVVHVACENAKGKTTAAEIVAGIWSKFESRTVPRWNETAGMKYWGPNALGNDTTALLVEHADGQCGAWANFFCDTLRVHSLSADNCTVTYGGYVPPYPEGFVSAEHGIYIKPLEGQGGTPSENKFINHAVVKTSAVSPNSVYDPSYGNKFDGSNMAEAEAKWEEGAVDLFYSRFVMNWPLLPVENTAANPTGKQTVINP